MTITRQHREFDCYCLDRLQPFENDLKITYNDGNIIRKVIYKVGLRANIKHQECFILYTASDRDFEQFIYIDADVYYDNQHRFFNDIISSEELREIIKRIKTMNIFEFVSLLDFINIYDEFKEMLEDNWDVLDMDNLIEI